jgi:folate-binding protein YgfZ
MRAGALAATAVRVEVGEPMMGRDVDESTIPQEAGPVDDAVDFTKGCYLGQELVARIDSRGHVNRRLCGVVVTTNVVPPEGAELMTGETAVGVLTSPAESLELRAPVALALVRREVDSDDPVVIRWSGGEAPGVVRELPLVP